MATTKFALRVQHSLFVLVAGISFVAAAYVQLFPPYRPSWLELSAQNLLKQNWALWPLLVALPLLFIAGLTAFLSRRIAAGISVVASSLALVYCLLMSCAYAAFAFIPFFLASGFITVGLPAVLAALVLLYSIHVLRAKVELDGPFRWIVARDGAHFAIKGVVVVTAVVAGLFLGIELLFHRTFQEPRRMTWVVTSNARCDYYVTLSFEEASAYSIQTCSSDLGTSLAADNSRTVEVVFLVTYKVGSWEYHVERVGQWAGEAEFTGLQLTCSAPGCPGSSGGPPFRQPYTLR